MNKATVRYRASVRGVTWGSVIDDGVEDFRRWACPIIPGDPVDIFVSDEGGATLVISPKFLERILESVATKDPGLWHRVSDAYRPKKKKC